MLLGQPPEGRLLPEPIVHWDVRQSYAREPFYGDEAVMFHTPSQEHRAPAKSLSHKRVRIVPPAISDASARRDRDSSDSKSDDAMITPDASPDCDSKSDRESDHLIVRGTVIERNERDHSETVVMNPDLQQIPSQVYQLIVFREPRKRRAHERRSRFHSSSFCTRSQKFQFSV
jgi:hypothetical protein